MTPKTAVTPKIAQTVLENCMCLRVQRASRVVDAFADPRNTSILRPSGKSSATQCPGLKPTFRRKMTHSFDQLVGPAKQRQREIDSERVGRFEIDD